MSAHVPLLKSHVRELASVSLVFAGVATIVAFGDTVIDSLLHSPDSGIWITQALNECDLHHLFGLPLKPSEAPMPAADGPLLQVVDPCLRHVAIVSAAP